jgi:hypothetical protein
MPYTEISLQQAARVELARGILQELAKHEQIQYLVLLTGDEWWMFYAYDHRTMWVASWDGRKE